MDQKLTISLILAFCLASSGCIDTGVGGNNNEEVIPIGSTLDVPLFADVSEFGFLQSARVLPVAGGEDSDVRALELNGGLGSETFVLSNGVLINDVTSNLVSQAIDVEGVYFMLIKANGSGLTALLRYDSESEAFLVSGVGMTSGSPSLFDTVSSNTVEGQIVIFFENYRFVGNDNYFFSLFSN